MPEDIHVRARRLIECDPVEGIAPSDREWLDRHIETCCSCADFHELTRRAIGVVRSASVSLPPDLAFRAQFRVSLRRGELREQDRGWTVWISFALCWFLGIASAPLVWRAFDWFGRTAGLPTLGVKLAFGVWLSVPAAIAAVIWMLEKRSLEER